MTEVVVVPAEEASTPEGGEVAGVAFAAGMATAEAAQAGEEAAEAAAVAEVATQEAAGAAAVAVDASATAWAARDEVDQLRAEFGAGLDEIRGMIADLAVEDAPAEGPLTPERIEREEGPAPEGEEGEHQEPAAESKSTGRKYGNPRWFGGR